MMRSHGILVVPMAFEWMTGTGNSAATAVDAGRKSQTAANWSDLDRMLNQNGLHISKNWSSIH